MAETRGGVVAISDTRYEDRRYESVAGKVEERLLCRGLHGEAGLEGPSYRE